MVGGPGLPFDQRSQQPVGAGPGPDSRRLLGWCRRWLGDWLGGPCRTRETTACLSPRGTATYTNDENGNTLTDGAANRTMTWDSQNRMASCTLNGTTSTFTYGADGLRRRMVTGTNTTDYLLDGQSVVREIKNGTVSATYLNGPRGPEYKRDQNGAVQWYLYDGLGSVVGLVDESGNVTNSRKYDVYGSPRNAQTGSAHCFVGGLGHTSDAETGLIYMRARYMDPATGRFVSEDPKQNGSNWFPYASANPVNVSDPDGQVDAWVVGILAYIAGLLNGAMGNYVFELLRPILAQNTKRAGWALVKLGLRLMHAGLRTAEAGELAIDSSMEYPLEMGAFQAGAGAVASLAGAAEWAAGLSLAMLGMYLVGTGELMGGGALPV